MPTYYGAAIGSFVSDDGDQGYEASHIIYNPPREPKFSTAGEPLSR